MPFRKDAFEKKKINNKKLRKQFEEKEITYDERIDESQVFNASLDEFGFCVPEKPITVEIDLENLTMEVV